MNNVIELNNTSLVCIETRFPELALFAIRQSTKILQFDEIILFSDKPFDVPSPIKNIIIPPIKSTEEYSEFMIKKLPHYISTDYILTIQWDGFIANSDLWSDEFLKYDYIGAPWGHRPVKVGNGGFSLRSKKLLDAAQTIVSLSYHPKDRIICETYKDYLEENFEISFAPENVASKFAFEDVYVNYETFGFHALYNIAYVLKNEDLYEYISLLPNSILTTRLSRRLIKKLYYLGKYESALFLIKRSIFKSFGNIFRCSILSVMCLYYFFKNQIKHVLL